MECSASASASPAVPVTARGRPRTFDPDTALAAALRVFWTRGYEGASMAELTEAMGITKPSLYACFGNKESLFRKALDLYDQEKLAYVGIALQAPTARQVAQQLLEGAIATHCGSDNPTGCLGVISTMSGTVESSGIRDAVLTRRLAAEEALTQRLIRAQQEGDLGADQDPKALAVCLTLMLQGMSVRAQANPCADTLKSAVESFMVLWPSA